MPIDIGDSTATVRSKINAVLTDAGLNPADNVDTTAATTLLNEVAGLWDVDVNFVDRMPEMDFRIAFDALEEGGGGGVPQSQRVIFLGASHTDQALYDVGLPAFKAAVLAAHPSYLGALDIYNEAVSGSTSTDLRNTIDTILAKYPNDRATTVVWEIGGNDVSVNRPYASGAAHVATLASNINYVDAAIRAKGFASVLGDLTFRDYDDTTFAREQLGSRPYNINVIRPLVGASWRYASGRPMVQSYDVFRNGYLTLIDVDNVHHTPAGKAALRQLWIDTVFKKLLTGVTPTEIAPQNNVIVKAHLYTGADVGLVNWSRVQTDGAPNSITDLIDFGSNHHDTGWDIVMTTPVLAGNNGTTGKSTGNNSGIVPDAALMNFTFASDAVDNGLGFGKFAFKVTGLDPSRSYIANMGGSRDTTGSRITRYTVEGNVQTLECVNNTSSQSTHAGLTPSAGGELTVLVEQTNHGFGYASWFLLTQEAA